MRAIPNPKRGCGRLVPGGTYLRSSSSSFGKLEPWAWILGHQIVGGRNFNVTVPARQLELINLPATLYWGRVIYDPQELPDDAPEQYRKLPPVALLDHVGSVFYTPWSFAQETARYGPSRRIPQALGEQIALFTPLPILFAHSWMPVVDKEKADELAAWARVSRAERLTEPTPDQPTWGLEADNDRGEAHWVIPVLEAMHNATNGKEKVPAAFLPEPLAQATLTTEEIFGASWITDVVKITTGSETDSDLATLTSKGIEPVTIAWEDE